MHNYIIADELVGLRRVYKKIFLVNFALNGTRRPIKETKWVASSSDRRYIIRCVIQ